VLFVYYNWYGGLTRPLHHWYDVTHTMWISVPQSIVLLPALVWVSAVAIKGFGGLRSALGRGLLFLALGVFSWGVAGNGVFFLYQVSHHGGAVPYPWWSDVGYVGLLPFYGIGMLFLSRLVGLVRSGYLRMAWVPVAVGAVTYWLTLPTHGLPGWLHGNQWVLTTWNNFTSKPTFFGFNANMASFGYLLMDTVVLSWAVVVLVNARRASGGVFVPALRLVVLSLGAQYLADLVFDQRIVSTTHPYHTGDIATILYTASMFLMTFAIASFAEIARKLNADVERMLEQAHEAARAGAELAPAAPAEEAPT
jgi:hypothetical protein